MEKMSQFLNMTGGEFSLTIDYSRYDRFRLEDGNKVPLPEVMFTYQHSQKLGSMQIRHWLIFLFVLSNQSAKHIEISLLLHCQVATIDQGINLFLRDA